MARIARVVVPGIPHHIIQRGNRKQNVFFESGDKEAYLKILNLQATLFEMDVWAYCLMDNHVHLIVVPRSESALLNGISETHQLYTRMVNFREGWRGYLWQGRFKSVPMDERYTYAAIRYVERNPVRAGIVLKAEDYLWSSAKWHVDKESHPLLSNFYLLDDIKDWRKYLGSDNDALCVEMIKEHSRTGRPLGDTDFMGRLEEKLGRILKKKRPGPKQKN